MAGYEWGPAGERERAGVRLSLELSSQELEKPLTFQPHKVTGWVQLPSKGCLLLEEHLWTMLDISWREITAGDRCPVHKHCSSLRIWKIRKNWILAHNHPCTWEQVLHNKNKVPIIGEFRPTSPPFIQVPGKLALWREVAIAEFCTMTTLVIQLNFFPTCTLRLGMKFCFQPQSTETNQCGSHWIYQNRDTQFVPTKCNYQVKLKAIFIA